MTKLLLCLDCGDIVNALEKEPRICKCKRHGCWWKDGFFVVYDYQRHECPKEIKHLCGYKPNHRVIGIHNDIFNIWNNGKELYKDQIQKMLDETSDHYLFKSWNSPIIVIEVGYTGDMRWADYGMDKQEMDQTTIKILELD